MHHEIRAQLDRAGQDRGRHSVVDDHPHVRGVCDRRHRGEVDDVPGRVGGRLEPKDTGVSRPDRGTNGGDVARVDELHVEAPRHPELREPASDAPVENPGDDDVVTRQERLEHRRGGGASGRKQHARGSALEHGQEPFGVLIGWVVGTRIGAPVWSGSVGICLIDRRDMDRRHERSRGSVDFAECLRGECFS